MMKALIFDFDGLILDTEGPDYESWRELYASYGCTLPFATWSGYIGAGGPGFAFDVYGYLEAQLGSPVDRAAVRAVRRARLAELVAAQAVLPGVTEYLADARRLGLRLAIASSGTREWVAGHLGRLGLDIHFACVTCKEDVPQTKPDPALYLAALQSLDVAPSEAIAFEDSPNGIRAAKQAGLYCVAVPNPLTRGLPLDEADLRLDSLAELPLAALLRKLRDPR
jgi:HAD superfamily hydrolase (TIGR01509 family)